MVSDRQLSQDPRRRWFPLDELVDSVLADAVNVDAEFQLSQGLAWRQLADRLKSQAAIDIDSVDLAESFGRLSNLGVDRFSLTLDLDLYRPPWWSRLWWFLAALLGKSPPSRPALYRLTRGRRTGSVSLCVQACRRHGRWQCQSDTLPSHQEVA